MAKKENPNLQLYGAGVLLTHLTSLVQEMSGVRRGDDIEAVHRMRVATRRLRATLPLFGPSLAGKRHLEWIKTARGITRALGEARDSDVQIEHVSAFLAPLQPPYRSGARRLLLRLKQQRIALQPKVLKALDKFEKSGLVTEMAQKLAPFDIYRDRLDSSDPILFETANQAIRGRLEEFLAFDEIVHQPEKIVEIHAMRIAAKHLRYTLETFAPLFEDGLKEFIKALRTSQDMLGGIHDGDVWTGTIDSFIEEERQRTIAYFGTARPFRRLAPGLLLYKESRRNERDATYAAFVQLWEEWKAGGIWESLTAVLDGSLAREDMNHEDTEKAEEGLNHGGTEITEKTLKDSDTNHEDTAPLTPLGGT